VHDAALETAPASLAPGQLLGLWVSLPVPPDAPAGPHQDSLTLAGVTVPLAWEVLPVPLGERPFGFYAMGFSRDTLRQYYRWDDETAFRHLPDLIRQARELGVDGYVYDVQGISLALDGAGKLVVDIAGLQRELAAVAAGGGMRYEEITSLTYLYQTYRPLFIKLSGAKTREEEETAWDTIAPAIRAALDAAGLERRLICRHGDEIGDYAEWLVRARRYRAAGVRMTVAINGYGVEHKHEAIGAMDHWIPLYNFFLNRWGKSIADDEPTMFSRQFRDARHAAGETIWPYVCGPGPYAWSPRPRSQVRWLVTDTYLKGADGLSYYGGLVWSHALDPAYRKKELAPLFTADCTFSALYYPDPAGAPRLWPSLRAVVVRQGLEDVAAMAALRRLAAARGLQEACNEDLAATFDIVTDTSPQAVFDDFRRDLATLAQQLAQP
jgi:hypothetical protein